MHSSAVRLKNNFHFTVTIFYCSAIKTIIMAVPLIGAHGRKNSLRFSTIVFYCSAIKRSQWPCPSSGHVAEKTAFASLRLFFIMRYFLITFKRQNRQKCVGVYMKEFESQTDGVKKMKNYERREKQALTFGERVYII